MNLRRHLLQDRSGVRLEKRADEKRMIRGYAAVFYRAGDAGTEYWLWDDIVERIAPGAFDRAVKEKHDARCPFNHDPNQVLARVSAGNCRFGVDSVGLWYEADEDPSDPDWQRVAAKIDRGDITGSSFSFNVKKATWSEVNQKDKRYWIRSIEDVDLYDFCPVTWPAYSGTSAGRSSDFRQKLDLSERSVLLAERDLWVGDDLPAINARLAEIGAPILQ